MPNSEALDDSLEPSDSETILKPKKRAGEATVFGEALGACKWLLLRGIIDEATFTNLWQMLFYLPLPDLPAPQSTFEYEFDPDPKAIAKASFNVELDKLVRLRLISNKARDRAKEMVRSSIQLAENSSGVGLGLDNVQDS